MLTAERLREILHYDPATGIWTRVSTGKETGWIDASNGYRRIFVDGQKIYASRLAWFWMTGAWPASLVDHKDEDRLNNRWGNLREATKSTNGANRGATAKNTSGLKGVSYCSATRRWRADIMVSGKRINFGRHASPEMAHAAYVRAAAEHFGEFAKAV